MKQNEERAKITSTYISVFNGEMDVLCKDKEGALEMIKANLDEIEGDFMVKFVEMTDDEFNELVEV